MSAQGVVSSTGHLDETKVPLSHVQGPCLAGCIPFLEGWHVCLVSWWDGEWGRANAPVLWVIPSLQVNYGLEVVPIPS